MNSAAGVLETIDKRRNSELINRLIAVDCELMGSDRSIGYFQQFAYINDTPNLLYSSGSKIPAVEFFDKELGGNLWMRYALELNGIESLYSQPYHRNPDNLTHQARMLFDLCSPASQYTDVCCCLPQSSGRSTAAMLAMFHTLVDRIGSVLFISPTETDAELMAGKTEKFLKKSLWGQLITLSRFYSGEHLDPQIITNVGFSTPQGLHNSLLPRHEDHKEFLADIDLVVMDGCETYHGTFGSHCSLVFRRLRRIMDYYGASPRYFVIMAPFDNAVQFTHKLLGWDDHQNDRSARSISLVADGQDTKKRPQKKLAFWSPALHYSAQSRQAPIYKMTLGRDALGDGLTNLFNALAVCLSDMPHPVYRPQGNQDCADTLIVLSHDGSLTNDDAKEWRRAIGWKVHVINSMNQLDEKHHLANNRTEQQSGYRYDKRVLVVAGYPNSLSSLLQDIVHFGDENTLIVVALDNDPLSSYLLKRIDDYAGDLLISRGGERSDIIGHVSGTGSAIDNLKKDGTTLAMAQQILVLNPGNRRLLEAHMRFALAELRDMSRTQAKNYFGFGGELVYSGLRGNHGQKDIFRPEIDFHSVDCNLSVADNNLVPFYAEDDAQQEVGFCEKQIIAHSAFSGATLSFSGHRYKISAVESHRINGSLSSKIEYREPLSTYEFSIDTEESLDQKTIYIAKQDLGFHVGFGPIQITEKVLGYKNYDQYNYYEDDKVVSYKHPKSCKFNTYGLLIRFTDNTLNQATVHALKHLIKICLPIYIRFDNHEIQTVLFRSSELERSASSNEWDIVIFDNHPFGDCFSRFLNRMDTTMWRLLFETAYDLLRHSPGGDPSWQSLFIPDCRDTIAQSNGESAYLEHNKNLNQRAAFDFLGKVLDMDGHNREMALKYGESLNS